MSSPSELAGGLDPTTWEPELIVRLMAANDSTAGPPATGSEWAVATNFATSAFAAGRALEAGGSAADAFVVAGLVDCVLSPGASTLGGSMQALLRTSNDGVTRHVDGAYNNLLDDEDLRAGLSLEELTSTGKGVLVPGVLPGMHELWRQGGRLSWPDVIGPALYFAEHGFPVYRRWAAVLQAHLDKLSLHPEALRVLCPGGHPPAPGDLLVQPGVAWVLAQAGEAGWGDLYRGRWGAAIVEAVARAGGRLGWADLEAYEPRCVPAASRAYVGYQVHVPPNFLGLGLLYELALAEHLGLHLRPGRETPGGTLGEEIACTALSEQPAARIDLSLATPAERAAFEELFTTTHLSAAADQIEAGLSGGSAPVGQGTHSIAVADRDGNVVVGTTSTNWYAWGAGIFAGGVALNVAGYQAEEGHPPPGQRMRVSGIGHISTRPDRLVAAAATSSGSPHAQFQTILDGLGRGLDLATAASKPRFGNSWSDPDQVGRVPLEAEMPERVVLEAQARGVRLVWPAAWGDGVLTGVEITSDGLRHAFSDSRFRGYAIADSTATLG